MNCETLKLVRVTLFVENLEAQTAFYGETLKLPAIDIRAGWSEFGDGDVTIALHHGKGRKPRLEFVTAGSLEDSRTYLNAQGARLNPIKELRGKPILMGKDRDGNNIQISEQP
ncbi:MAG: VOC family protein [Cyanobacteria bacterium P01_D01_bin.105]